jgi:hypothetical protein
MPAEHVRNGPNPNPNHHHHHHHHHPYRASFTVLRRSRRKAAKRTLPFGT